MAKQKDRRPRRGHRTSKHLVAVTINLRPEHIDFIQNWADAGDQTFNAAMRELLDLALQAQKE